MSSLTTLRLRDCRLYGKFPTSIFRLPNLQFLNVEDNENLTGCLPEFHRTSPLKALEIARTNFFGILPDSIGNLESLSILALNECNFSGMLPASLGNLAQLTILHLGTNHFWGKIPSSLSNLTQLTHLRLGNNNFDVGALLLILGKLSKLSVIDLEGMKIHGDIPQSLANMTQLTYLSLRSNELLGQIPSWLMNATQLIALDLSHNQLQGMIPSSISQLEHLESLDFADNNLIGKVKIDIFLKLLNLNAFYLSGNKLTVLSKNSTNTTLPKIISLGLASCNLREFPDFLRFQDELRIVFLGNLPSDYFHNWNAMKMAKTEIWTYMQEASESLIAGTWTSSLPPPSLSFQSDDSKFPSGVDWIVIFMGLGSGLIVGLVIGQALTTRYHEWFVMTFGKGNQTQRRKGRRN
ncbi:hypothetical protein TEA_008536 [Camellia sinensis var. sinensis]|uniref:Disease resistance R13L4/SHOC-2-like LRR domain-containing protein n=1 Tax=Camellia sinensis var. sinensis TaxID=542762 RepID=A0A4S4DKZ6_CAMSN|nr:hypothetical protein TEA_008536 [Camellia sinensis var. sinensis]